MTSTSHRSDPARPEAARPEVLPPLAGDPAAPAAANWTSKAVAGIAALISVLYLANIGAGLFELGPDFLPGVGNLDEVFFTGVLIYSLRQFGIDLLPHLRRIGRSGKS